MLLASCLGMAQASAEDPLNYTLFAIKLDGFCLDPLELGLESALTLNPDGTKAN